MHRYTAICLAGAFCFLISGSRAEAAKTILSISFGSIIVFTEIFHENKNKYWFSRQNGLVLLKNKSTLNTVLWTRIFQRTPA